MEVTINKIIILMIIISLTYACQCNYKLITAKNRLNDATGRELPGNKVIIYLLSTTTVAQFCLIIINLIKPTMIDDEVILIYHILIILSNLTIASKASRMAGTADKLRKLYKELDQRKNSA